MTDKTQEMDEKNVTTRLAGLVKRMPAFVDRASAEEKQALVAVFEEMMPLYVRLLEDLRHEDRREHPRRACSVTAFFPTWEGSFKSSVRNISAGGMFMETKRELPAGHEITVSLPSPSNEHEMIKVTGEIVWSVPEGLGIRFTSPLSKELEDVIASI